MIATLIFGFYIIPLVIWLHVLYKHRDVVDKVLDESDSPHGDLAAKILISLAFVPILNLILVIKVIKIG